MAMFWKYPAVSSDLFGSLQGVAAQKGADQKVIVLEISSG
jgi:hypothetical protein